MHQLLFEEVSAKNSTNVEYTINLLVKKLLEDRI